MLWRMTAKVSSAHDGRRRAGRTTRRTEVSTAPKRALVEVARERFAAQEIGRAHV